MPKKDDILLKIQMDLKFIKTIILILNYADN